MSERIGFLSKIIAEPEENLHREVYADWLDENGEPERAEFIRVQVKIETSPQCLVPQLEEIRFFDDGPVEKLYRGGCGRCQRCVSLEKLRRRERELLNVGRHEWQGAAAEIIPKGSFIDERIKFRRGFIEEITCNPDVFWKYGLDLIWDRNKSCIDCSGLGTQYSFPFPFHKNRANGECSRCHGSGKEPIPCPATAQPITCVNLTSRPDIEYKSLANTQGDDFPCVFKEMMRVPARTSAKKILEMRFPGVKFTIPNQVVTVEFSAGGRGVVEVSDEFEVHAGDDIYSNSQGEAVPVLHYPPNPPGLILGHVVGI